MENWIYENTRLCRKARRLEQSLNEVKRIVGKEKKEKEYEGNKRQF